MAVPVLLGLPWLAGAISSLFVSAFTYLTALTVKRLSLIVAGLAVIASVTGLFSVAIAAVLDGLLYNSPVTSAVFLIIPANFPTVVGAYITLRLLRWAYDWNIRVIRMVTKYV